jgi:predicted N-acetyltransferase YhbS
MIIRPEQPADAQSIRTTIERAFANHPHSTHNEQRIVDALRAANALSVSLVATDGDTVIGHVACSRVVIERQQGNWYGLGPISVAPSVQRRGVGTKLMHAAIAELRERADGIVLLGDPAYYTRFGFKACTGLLLPGVPATHFLYLAFVQNLPQGVVTYHDAFAIE